MTRRTVAILLTLLALAVIPARPSAVEWQPINPADLTLKTPSVDKDADAEGIFWEIWVTDNSVSGKLDFENYLRIKIFTEHGRDAHSTIDLPYENKGDITDIAGRTIKPEGSIVPLAKDAVYERVLAKAGGFKIRAKSFAMPAVEPGAVIEYRWRERVEGLATDHIPLQFQLDIPVRLVRYHLKAQSSVRANFGLVPFNYGEVQPVDESKGYHAVQLTNVPAFVREPYMPPDNQVRSWVLAFYQAISSRPDSDYWADFGRGMYQVFKPLFTPNGEMRQTAATVVSGAPTDLEKLRRLFDYCRTKIKNSSNESVTAEERAAAARNKNPADTLKRGVGNGLDIDVTFAALANAAGYDARLALLPDRSYSFFNRNIKTPYFLRRYEVAIRLGDGWRFFDPANTYANFGMLRWQEEGEAALVSDPKAGLFVNTPLSPPEKSATKRIARLALSPDGTLEGYVRVEYSGHEAVSRKRAFEAETPDQQIEYLQKLVKERFSTAEVTGAKVANATDLEKPVIYEYHLKIPGYAERTGKRLFLHPAFFQFNTPALFTASSRKYPVYFEYPWSEEDAVVILMPPGFELDHAEQAPRVDFGKPGKYETNLGVSKSRELVYTRKFSFGADGNILYPATAYAQVKHVFDLIHEADDHIVTMKQEVAAK